jgi:hypothetical protein
MATGEMGNAIWITAGPRHAGYPTVMTPRHPPVTQALVPVSAADTPIGPPGKNLEDRLDEAIQETFPASDPISTAIEDPAHSVRNPAAES